MIVRIKLLILIFLVLLGIPLKTLAGIQLGDLVSVPRVEGGRTLARVIAIRENVVTALWTEYGRETRSLFLTSDIHAVRETVWPYLEVGEKYPFGIGGEGFGNSVQVVKKIREDSSLQSALERVKKQLRELNCFGEEPAEITEGEYSFRESNSLPGILTLSCVLGRKVFRNFYIVQLNGTLKRVKFEYKNTLIKEVGNPLTLPEIFSNHGLVPTRPFAQMDQVLKSMGTGPIAITDPRSSERTKKVKFRDEKGEPLVDEMYFIRSEKPELCAHTLSGQAALIRCEPDTDKSSTTSEIAF